VISQFLGFFAWYRGLALGGVARVSQLQLLQPFLTLAASAFLLGERLTPLTIVVALIVVAAVAIGRTGARGGQAAQSASQQKDNEPLRIAPEAIHHPRRE
jgi:drug/metabolite transporter (DMT)-like permease